MFHPIRGVSRGAVTASSRAHRREATRDASSRCDRHRGLLEGIASARARPDVQSLTGHDREPRGSRARWRSMAGGSVRMRRKRWRAIAAAPAPELPTPWTCPVVVARPRGRPARDRHPRATERGCARARGARPGRGRPRRRSREAAFEAVEAGRRYDVAGRRPVGSRSVRRGPATFTGSSSRSA